MADRQGEAANYSGDCTSFAINAALKRAEQLVEYGNRLPDGVTTEAFAEASLIRGGVKQLEEAAVRLSEAEAGEQALIAAIRHIIADSPGTPDSVKRFLSKTLAKVGADG